MGTAGFLSTRLCLWEYLGLVDLKSSGLFESHMSLTCSRILRTTFPLRGSVFSLLQKESTGPDKISRNFVVKSMSPLRKKKRKSKRLIFDKPF